MRLWLKKLRESNDLTQAQMAAMLGIPITTYSSYEQGHRTPKVDDAKVLADKLGVNWTIFFEENIRGTSTSGKEVVK